MKALAEFILRGRFQAFTVALIGNFFPFIGQAAIGLVSLSKGVAQGFWVFMWVSLPLVLMHYISADNPLLITLSIASLGLMVVTAGMHKALASWQWTILTAMAVSSVIALSCGLLMQVHIETLISQVKEFLSEISSGQNQTSVQLVMTEPMLLGLVAMILSAGSIISLMISRWWQSLIHNPGGFQNEFHSFKIESKIAVVLVVVTLAGILLPKEYQFWVQMVAMPLVLAGIALIHFAVKLQNLGGHWLLLLYVTLLLFATKVAVFIIVLAVADSFLDIRSRLVEHKNHKL